MQKICIIPARMGSSRFPGKPLAIANGLPLIVHVAKRCMLARDLDHIAVATCDEEISRICTQHNISSIMTSSNHERCTDRVSEAVGKLDLELTDEDLVLMVQGDEILVTPDMLSIVVKEYRKSKMPVINLLSRIYQEADHADPNVVKVVFSTNHKALYFSRAPIPSIYRDENALLYQQTGVIGFSLAFLNKFSSLPQTYLEKIESIDMLRVLEHGLPLQVVCTELETVAVDVPYDLKRASKILLNDDLVKQYV